MQPPPRRKFFQSVKSLLLNPLQVEVVKKQSSGSRSGEEAILCEGSCGHWLHRLAGLSKLLLPECLNHPASFVVLSVLSVLKKRRLRLLRVVSQSLIKRSVSKLESKLDSLMNSLSMTISPLGMDPQQIP